MGLLSLSPGFIDLSGDLEKVPYFPMLQLPCLESRDGIFPPDGWMNSMRNVQVHGLQCLGHTNSLEFRVITVFSLQLIVPMQFC